MPEYNILLKKVEPQLVASHREIIATYQEVGKLFEELFGYLARFHAGGLCAALWHDAGFKAKDVDAEAVVYLENPVPESDRVKVYALPGYTVASVIHKGSYNNLNQAYEAIWKWIEDNGFRCCAPNREIYLYSPEPFSNDNESYVTEIQFPVEKA